MPGTYTHPHHSLASLLKHYRTPLLVSLLVVILDQLTKGLVLSRMYPHQSIPLLPGIFHLTYIQNTGIIFGLFQNTNTFFLVLSLCIIIGVLYILLQVSNTDRTIQILLGMLLGGAIGNVIDRFMLKFVVDFIDVRFFYVFNVADSAITLSIIALIIFLWNK